MDNGAIASKSRMINLEEDSLSALDRIDYGPVHRCCQIFNVLVNIMLKINKTFSFFRVIKNALKFIIENKDANKL